MRSAKAQELAAMLYAVAKLGAKPPDDWLAEYFDASCDRLPGAWFFTLYFVVCVWAQ